ncbi:MAG: type VI secretion system baseplate subunit TssF [Deltaproteobacteria bacterium]|jgi:type VI secretion system protein ImpG|nr:type VI secretion system baseplate subunit TssF [Deltaproteobacteria bacterium]
MSQALKDLYQEELAKLRVWGSEFSRDNPALAPMLGAKGDDPDVERLLEGVAFMSSLVRKSINDGFPDLVQSLLRLVCPSALQPVPSLTIMAFKPVRGFAESLLVPAGAALASIPVDGVSAKFTTTTPLTVLPAAITKVEVEDGRGGEGSISLTVTSAAPLKSWASNTLVFHLAGDYPEACERRRVLLRRIKTVEIESQGVVFDLGPESLGLWGFGPEERALPNQLLLAFNLIQEYFVSPQKLMFLKVTGLKVLSENTNQSFIIRFRLANLAAPLAPARAEDFILNAVPAINVFSHPAHPLVVDHKSNEYLLKPQDQEAEKLGVFSVEEVVSRGVDGETRVFQPFETFRKKNQWLYRVIRRISPITGQGEYYLSFLYSKDHKPILETITASLKCHNGSLTDSLRTGEINLPTDTSPSMVSFANIIPPTRACPPIDSDWRLWRFISHLQVNINPTMTVEGLKEILNLHAQPNDPDLGRVLSNTKRIEAVEELSIKLEDYFLKGRPYRGSRVELTVDPQGFASTGDLGLFGEVLDHFFGLFHQINVYSRLVIKLKNVGRDLTWPPRLGVKRLT